MHVSKISLALVISSFSMRGAQEHTINPFLPQEIVQELIVQKSNDLPLIGNFGQTCKKNNEWYTNFMICKDPSHDEYGACKSGMCFFTKKNFDACTYALRYYAKMYKKDKNEHCLSMFQHLWRHHAEERYKGVLNLLGVDEPGQIPEENIIDIYAGCYAVKEMEIVSVHTRLAQEMKRAVVKENSRRLKEFLIKSNIVAVKIMFLADNFLFDPTWSGYKLDRDDYGNGRGKYKFGHYKKDTIVECACRLKDVSVLNLLVNRSEENCFDIFSMIIKALIKCGNIVLLGSFIQKNHRRALPVRFSIWNKAIKNHMEKDCKILLLESIIGLFSQDINEQNEQKRTLLLRSIEERDECAVSFLLDKGADFQIQHYGIYPLYLACSQPTIVSLLLAKGAGVNQRNTCGKVALMAAIFNEKVDKNTYEVMQLLLQAGAEVDAVDFNGCSALHHYANAGIRGEYILKIVELLLQYKANPYLKNVDGYTPFDYVQLNKNRALIELFAKYHDCRNDVGDSLSNSTSCSSFLSSSSTSSSFSEEHSSGHELYLY